jgi:hypothetical protein
MAATGEFSCPCVGRSEWPLTRATVVRSLANFHRNGWRRLSGSDRPPGTPSSPPASLLGRA